jgi:CheY-like chemotaxis protein
MKEKILVVDDEQSHRAMLKAVLTKEGYDISEADDGISAVRAVENEPFDLILMDIRMTDMDGIEAVGQIKKNESFDSRYYDDCLRLRQDCGGGAQIWCL